MTKHPLWSLSDEALEAVCDAGKAPVSLRNAFRVARGTPPDSDTAQRLLAAFHGLCPKPDGFRWPWKALDGQLGLLPMGEMAVVLGQTGQGKTTFTSSLVNRLIATTPCLVFATETPAERYLTQLAARRANLHPDKVVQGDWSGAGFRLTAEEARTKYFAALNELQSLPLSIAPYLSLRATQMRQSLEESVKGRAPEVVIVDHFQAIEHDLGEGFQGQQETLRVLHQFAHDHYLTLIVTNQAHLRGTESPKAHDCINVAGNFGGQTLMQFAAQVVGLHRVLSDTHLGNAVNPKFVQEFTKGGGSIRELYDRQKVAVDICKLRYDAHGTTGSEVRLLYRDGAYHDIED